MVVKVAAKPKSSDERQDQLHTQPSPLFLTHLPPTHVLISPSLYLLLLALVRTYVCTTLLHNTRDPCLVKAWRSHQLLSLSAHIFGYIINKSDHVRSVVFVHLAPRTGLFFYAREDDESLSERKPTS